MLSTTVLDLSAFAPKLEESDYGDATMAWFLRCRATVDADQIPKSRKVVVKKKSGSPVFHFCEENGLTS